MRAHPLRSGTGRLRSGRRFECEMTLTAVEGRPLPAIVVTYPSNELWNEILGWAESTA